MSQAGNNYVFLIHIWICKLKNVHVHSASACWYSTITSNSWKVFGTVFEHKYQHASFCSQNPSNKIRQSTQGAPHQIHVNILTPKTPQQDQSESLLWRLWSLFRLFGELRAMCILSNNYLEIPFRLQLSPEAFVGGKVKSLWGFGCQESEGFVRT